MDIHDFLVQNMLSLNSSQLNVFEQIRPEHSNITLLDNARFNSSFESPFEESDYEFQRVIGILNTYVLPAIILIGIIGNTLSFFVYIWTPRLFCQSSSIYLAFLAMVDNISLVSVLVVWFGWVGVHIFHKNGWCQTITYCTYVCSFLSAWTVVTFTLERWIIVFHPLRRHELCTRRRAIIVMTSLTMTSLAFYSFALYTTTVSHHNGMPVCTTHHNSALKIVRSIDTMMTVVVPLLAIILMNLGIGIRICHYTGRRRRDGSTSQACSTAPPDSADDPYTNFSTTHHRDKCTVDMRRLTGVISATDQAGTLRGPLSVSTGTGGTAWRVLTRRRHTQVRVTSALLVVSTVFVALNLPSYAFRIHAFVISIRDESYELSLNAYIWQEFIQFLYYSNISSRFFLYTACSRNFRYAVKRLACKQQCNIRCQLANS